MKATELWELIFERMNAIDTALEEIQKELESQAETLEEMKTDLDANIDPTFEISEGLRRQEHQRWRDELKAHREQKEVSVLSRIRDIIATGTD